LLGGRARCRFKERSPWSGATRGAGRGIAVELGAAAATVYVTGRTTRERPSEYARPEHLLRAYLRTCDHRFLNGVETGTPAEPTFRTALQTQKVCDAILQSGKTGQGVETGPGG
jgi:predicted dehydrogenase